MVVRSHAKQMSALGMAASNSRARVEIEPNEILVGIYQDSLTGCETLLNSQRGKVFERAAIRFHALMK